MYYLIAISTIFTVCLLFWNSGRSKSTAKYPRPFKTVRVYEEGSDPILDRMEFYIRSDDDLRKQDDKDKFS